MAGRGGDVFIGNVLQGGMPPWQIVLLPVCHVAPDQQYRGDDQYQRRPHDAAMYNKSELLSRLGRADVLVGSMGELLGCIPP